MPGVGRGGGMVAVSKGDTFAFCCVTFGVRTIVFGTVLSGTKVAGWFKTRLIDGDKQHQFRLTADKFCPDSVDELEEGQWTFAPAPTPFEQPQAVMTPAPRSCTSGLPGCRCRTGKTKPVLQLDSTTGAVVARFCSLFDAQRKTGVTSANIQRVAGSAKFQAGGFRWRYVGAQPAAETLASYLTRVVAAIGALETTDGASVLAILRRVDSMLFEDGEEPDGETLLPVEFRHRVQCALAHGVEEGRLVSDDKGRYKLASPVLCEKRAAESEAGALETERQVRPRVETTGPQEADEGLI